MTCSQLLSLDPHPALSNFRVSACHHGWCSLGACHTYLNSKKCDCFGVGSLTEDMLTSGWQARHQGDVWLPAPLGL